MTKLKEAPAVKAPKALVLIVGAASIAKAVDSIGTRGAKLDGDIQLAGLSIIMHVDTCGDTTLADRLFNAMPKGSRRNALAEWFISFGKVRVLSNKNKDDAAALAAGRVFQFDKSKKTDQEGAIAKPWFECKKEADVATTFDVQDAFNQFMKRVQKAQSDGLKIEHGDMIEKLAKAMQSS